MQQILERDKMVRDAASDHFRNIIDFHLLFPGSQTGDPIEINLRLDLVANEIPVFIMSESGRMRMRKMCMFVKAV